MRKYLTVIVFLSLHFSNVLEASNGVVEINHICATQLGCFNGDSVNYPVRIDGTAGKSYRLTSDLIIPNENTHGIDVASPSISIDLNGFSIVRSGCENTTDDCTSGTGTGSGITMSSTTYFGLTVKNGSIIGMGKRGISDIGSDSTYDNLHIRWNRETGVIVGDNSIIKNSTVAYNGGSGISLRKGSSAINNTVSYNLGTGMSASESVLILDNIVFENGGTGISVFQENSIAKGNTVYKNSGSGVSCAHSSSVSFNNIHSNGGDGVDVIAGCSAQENTIANNAGFGIDVSTASTQNINVLRGNILIENTLGTINGTNYFSLGKNFCETNDVCP